MHLGLEARIPAALPALQDKISVQCKTGREEAEQPENKQESFIVQLTPHAQAR